MLVLTRKVGERILIGDDIVITVLDSRGDGVRIGIDAPRDTRIHRSEIVVAVSNENQDAISASRSADAETNLLDALRGGARAGASD